MILCKTWTTSTPDPGTTHSGLSYPTSAPTLSHILSRGTRPSTNRYLYSYNPSPKVEFFPTVLTGLLDLIGLSISVLHLTTKMSTTLLPLYPTTINYPSLKIRILYFSQDLKSVRVYTYKKCYNLTCEFYRFHYLRYTIYKMVLIFKNSSFLVGTVLDRTGVSVLPVPD